MSRDGDPQLDAFSVDVRGILDRNVANLYSHLVTRPTGRAVRMAIQAQLGELESPALSMVDLSSVSVLDYSCADEVVAKLLLARDRPRADGGLGARVFFVLLGLREHHREPLREVLLRQDLAVVVRPVPDGGDFELLGAHSNEEAKAWRRVEREGRIAAARARDHFDAGALPVLDRLVRRGLLFRHPLTGDLHALSSLIATF
ncbi:MAG: hypothetical protein ACOCUZ_02230 [bacterium]